MIQGILTGTFGLQVYEKRNNTITQMLEQNRERTRLGTSKEEQKNNKMETITGTLSQLRTSKKNQEFHYMH